MAGDIGNVIGSLPPGVGGQPGGITIPGGEYPAQPVPGSQQGLLSNLFYSRPQNGYFMKPEGRQAVLNNQVGPRPAQDPRLKLATVRKAQGLPGQTIGLLGGVPTGY